MPEISRKLNDLHILIFFRKLQHNVQGAVGASIIHKDNLERKAHVFHDSRDAAVQFVQVPFFIQYRNDNRNHRGPSFRSYHFDSGHLRFHHWSLTWLEYIESSCSFFDLRIHNLHILMNVEQEKPPIAIMPTAMLIGRSMALK